MKPIGIGLRSRMFAIFLVLLFNLSESKAFGQNLDAKIKGELETVVNYLSLNNEADQYLDRINFQRPSFISAAEWRAAPDVRKFTIAWKMAENKQQFVEALVKHVAADYNSIKSERKTSYHFARDAIPPVRFNSPANLPALERIPVPQNLKSEILTVSKYVTEGALGSMQSVFSNYMDLPENDVFDILSKASNNGEAFEQALLKSGVPPPHEEKLSRMARDLQEYEAMRRNDDLSRIAKRESRKPVSLTGEHIKPAGPELPASSGGSSTPSRRRSMSAGEARRAFASDYRTYSNYVEKSYPRSARSFKGMRGFRGGFGGVILGDSVRFSNTPRLLELRWRPINEKVTDDFEKRGFLEFFFADSSVKTYGPVLYEDVFAANAIVNDAGYRYGDGVGMVSIVGGSDLVFSHSRTRRFGVTLHPAVSRMRLGWALVITDALPTARMSFKKSLNATLGNDIERFYADNNETWKITDKQIRINSIGSRIKIDDIALTMFGFQYKNRKDTALTSRSFDRLLPRLCMDVEEYKRVNDFAKVFAILRWAKFVKSKITNITTYNSFVAKPLNVVLNNNDELEFYDFAKDRAAIKGERDYYTGLLERNREDSSARYSRKIDSLLKWFNRTTKGRAEIWNYTPATGYSFTEKAKHYFQTEDTSGYALIKQIGFIFIENDTLKKTKGNVGDSVLYFARIYNTEIDKREKATRQADSAIERSQRIIQAILRKYNIQSINQLGSRAHLMTSVDQRTILVHFDRMDEIDRELELARMRSNFVLAPFYRYANRNNLISLASLKAFIETEKDILLSYEN